MHTRTVPSTSVTTQTNAHNYSGYSPWPHVTVHCKKLSVTLTIAFVTRIATVTWF